MHNAYNKHTGHGHRIFHLICKKKKKKKLAAFCIKGSQDIKADAVS